jgi:cyclic pyranopterin phosphate synthase
MTKDLTHTDASGAVRMVDVGDKPSTDRRARAEASVVMSASTLELIRTNALKKGDVLSTARLAGIQAAKQTGNLIPLCHPLMLAHIDVLCALDDTLPGVRISTEVRCQGRTGVEMEALTAASVAALTVIDMAKAVDRSMMIQSVQLIEKSGGQKGDWKRPALPE